MKKILFIANTAIKNDGKPKKITNFTIPSYLAAKALGYEFHMTTDYKNPEEITVQYDDIKFHKIGIYRNPFSMDAIKAYKDLNRLLYEEKFDVIHCNTPIGGALGRLCGKKAKVPKIIYTVHGFHFYKGAPLINNTFFKWVEKWLARYTDVILTINQEDFNAAQKFKLRQDGEVYYVPGVGVDGSLIKRAESKRKEILQEIGANDDSILLISVGDINNNKNNRVIIKALDEIKNPKVHYLLCGIGDKKEELHSMAKDLGLEKNIHFLGFRDDVGQLFKSCDIFVMPSYREGLSRSLMEAMSAGLPCVVSKIRGNVDLVEGGKGGYLCHPDDIEGFAEAINVLTIDNKIRKKMSEYNLSKIRQFDVENIKIEMKKIYDKELL